MCNSQPSRKRHRISSEERSSTSELDSDSDDQGGHLFLDQSSADLFSTSQGATTFDDQLLDLRGDISGRDSDRKRPNAMDIPADQRDEVSALPSARILVFSPKIEADDIGGLVTLDATSQQIAYRDLTSGSEMWRLVPGVGEF